MEYKPIFQLNCYHLLEESDVETKQGNGRCQSQITVQYSVFLHVTPFSHTAPPRPAGHLQLKSFPLSSQVPPCRQGCESHGFWGL